jgi:hypothetical protein
MSNNKKILTERIIAVVFAATNFLYIYCWGSSIFVVLILALKFTSEFPDKIVISGWWHFVVSSLLIFPLYHIRKHLRKRFENND